MQNPSHTPKNYDFMRFRMQALLLSLGLLVLSVAGLAIKGLHFGIDFTGGTLVELAYESSADVDSIRDVLQNNGYERASVQNFGSDTEVLIRIAPQGQADAAQISNQVMDLLRDKQAAAFELRRVEFVGPQVGDELTEDGFLALIYALIGVLIYVALRFEFRFSLGSVAALIHDVVITLGVFAWTQVQFDLTVLAAILAVIGYSLNDTIVVFDRVRENFRTVRDGSPSEVSNLAINQMLARTIMTSLTTLLVLTALILIGGEVIYGFALALIVGVVIGTYSSIFVASSIALALGVSKEDLMKPVKEDDDTDMNEEALHRAFLEEEAAREAKAQKNKSSLQIR